MRNIKTTHEALKAINEEASNLIVPNLSRLQCAFFDYKSGINARRYEINSGMNAVKQQAYAAATSLLLPDDYDSDQTGGTYLQLIHSKAEVQANEN